MDSMYGGVAIAFILGVLTAFGDLTSSTNEERSRETAGQWESKMELLGYVKMWVALFLFLHGIIAVIACLALAKKRWKGIYKREIFKISRCGNLLM
ncbi:hypothetical protein H8E77_41490 [bacterium]|nr:hypothetical protein [bacterium]